LETIVMSYFLLAALAVALVVCLLALIRENRLRSALQRLLQMIFTRWRRNDQDSDSSSPSDRRNREL
jgi:hypothetical protein